MSAESMFSNSADLPKYMINLWNFSLEIFNELRIPPENYFSMQLVSNLFIHPIMEWLAARLLGNDKKAL